MAGSNYSFLRRTPDLSRRNEIYLGILRFGVLRLRDAGYAGDSRHCEIEADHLHNIPSYIAEGDGANHLYYLSKEVPRYLDEVDLYSLPNLHLLDFYIPLWKELESLIPIEGSPWEEHWRKMKDEGWSYDINERARAAAQRMKRKPGAGQ